ncbi:MAG: LacI family DNA-binding transcriptional regulator [Eubacteriales bacterium]|nr:LacI family DNA-binding transcriptional regulator [Eubacteriales bacterium]
MADNKPITIKDIAKRAGVAVSTVSRVMNNLDKVSPQTREKVLQAVDELGFVQNNFAVFLVTGQTKLILIVVPDFINGFFGSVIQGAERALRDAGYSTMVTSTGDKEHTEIASILKQLDYAVDGAIIIPTGNDATQYESFQKPIVLVDRCMSHCAYDTVLVDNFGGVYKLTEELLTAGHRKIAIITGDERLNIGRERLAGFRKAMLDYDVPVNEAYIARGDLYEEDGYRLMLKLFELSDRPTAVIAGNNLICSGVIVAAQELGLTVGRDFSLVSFDDQPIASLLQPSITVIDRPTTEMGVCAANMLIERMKSKQAIERRELVMPVTLLRRNSVCPLATDSI